MSRVKKLQNDKMTREMKKKWIRHTWKERRYLTRKDLKTLKD